MKFRLNLIREIKAEQEAAQKRRRFSANLFAICYSLLAVILIYGITDILTMRLKVAEERKRLENVKAEYQRYKSTTEIVSKADVELLDRLQNNRIFWTKKLLIMARCLPENYWITQFGHDGAALTVNGYGYITDRQEQLITLHAYLDGLRRDPAYNDVFKPTYLNSTIRADETGKGRERVSFSYTGIGGRLSP